MTDNYRNLPILRHKATESFCGICPEPGRCCQRFYFNRSYWLDEGLAEAQRELESWGSVPFVIIGWQPLVSADENGREYANVICKCPKVTEEGRCSIYETRSDACRNYAPGSDRLCVFSSMSGLLFHRHE